MLLPLEPDGAAGRVQADDAVGDADLALAGKAAQAQDLPFAHLQGHSLAFLAGHIHMQIVDLDQDLMGFILMVHRVDGGFDLAAYHLLGDVQYVGLSLGNRFDPLPVLHDGDVVRHAHDLVQTVGDEEDGDAGIRKHLHGLQQGIRFALRQHCRGLVEHQQLDTGLVDFPGDFHELLIADRQLRNDGFLVQVQAQTVQGLSGICPHTVHIEGFQLLTHEPAHNIVPGDFSIQFDILCHIEARDQHELLVHHPDAQFHGLFRGRDGNLLPVQPDLALKTARCVNHRHTEQDIHQGGLAGTVLAQQRVNLAPLHLQVDPFENPVAGVFLDDVLHLKHVLAHMHPPFDALQNVRLPRGNLTF